MCKRLIEEIENEKIIVIVRGVERNKLIPIAEAMYRGGIKFLEITYSANGEVSDEETKENIRLLANHFGGRLHIGAGTVLTEKQAELTKQAGGEFVISPDTNPKVIKRTKELRMVSMPGALTPSEIQLAHISGADFVKLFPVSNLGIDYVRAVKAPLSHIRLLAVGGVDLSNIPGYLDIGVCGFGIGSNIVSGKLIGQNDYKGLEELAKKYVSAVK